MKINRQGKSRTLDTEQLDLITSYLPSNKHKLISLLLRKSAARISEIVSLRYQDITPTTILIPKQVVKINSDLVKYRFLNLHLNR